MSEAPDRRGLYRRLLSAPHARPLLAWSVLARLPLGMTPLALLLLARGEGESYAAAGALTFAYGIALAAAGPLSARFVDRQGPRGPLLRRAFLHPAMLVSVVVLAEVRAPLWSWCAAAAGAGATLPPVAATVRTIWPRLVPDELRGTAYAIEATLQEVFFIGGPLLAGALAVFGSAGGVLGSAVAALVGTAAVASLTPVRAAEGASQSRTLIGALESVGVRTVALYALFLGLGFGMIEVGMPAFAEEHGSARELGSLALGAFSAGSLVGGILSGARAQGDPRRRALMLAPVVAVALWLVALAWSLPALVVLAFLAGAPIAPTVAAIYSVIDDVADRSRIAEAFAWFGVSVMTGVAIGTAISGALVDALGVRETFALGPAIVLAGSLVLWLRADTLRGPSARGSSSGASATLTLERP